MAIYKRRDSRFWWYSFWLDGRKFLGSTKCEKKDAAYNYYKEKWTEATRGNLPIKIKIKLSEMIEIYLKDHSSAVKKSYTHDLGYKKKSMEFFGDCWLAEVDQHKIEQFRANLIKTVSKSTINRYLAFLRHVFTKAIEWGKWGGENPVKRIKKFKEEHKPERYLTNEERKELMEKSPEFLRPIILVALKTGMRKSEILNLKWEDIDLQRGIINVRHTKAGKLRQLPIHGQLAEVLSRIPSKSPYVFCDYNGNKLSQNGTFRGSFERAVKDAKIFNFTFHDLRHTFASELLMKGVDVKTVQEYLGHSSVAVTERYLHVAPDQKRTSIQLLGKETGMDGYVFATFSDNVKATATEQLPKGL